MSNNKYKIRISILIILASTLLLLAGVFFIQIFHTGEEATVGILSLAATLIGTLFIVVELKNGSDVTCSEMLIEQNNYFHDSDRLMKVYGILEKCEMSGCSDGAMWEDVSSVEIAQYCTFFENLYLLYKHHIVTIDDLDDLFGYRFFIFMNNPYIQEHYILPTSSSYVQIFLLYSVWIKHRRHVPFQEYALPQSYLKDKLYLCDCGCSQSGRVITSVKGKTEDFVMKKLGFEYLSDIMALQDDVVKGMPDKDMFYPLSREELLESLHLDEVSGIFSKEGTLAAFCVVVSARDSHRNLAGDISKSPSDVLTFDAVVVGDYFRGNGFHKAFLDWSLAMAKEKHVCHIAATVDPSNTYSKNNFLSHGFKLASTVKKYNGLQRDILVFN